MTFVVDERTEACINAGVEMIKWAQQGKSKEYCWDTLGEMGFCEEDRVKIAKTVHGFMQHKNGVHKDCPPMCDQVEAISKERTGKESIQEVADIISNRNDLHDSFSFSKDIQEEFR